MGGCNRIVTRILFSSDLIADDDKQKSTAASWPIKCCIHHTLFIIDINICTFELDQCQQAIA